MTSAAAPPPTTIRDRWACPLCAVDDAQHVGADNGLDVARCTRCGLAYLRPRPTDAELATFYNESYYASNDAGSMGYAEYQRHEAGIRLVGQDHVDMMRTYQPPGRLLDVGCAYGFFLDTARNAGWDVTGVELAVDAAHAARDTLGLDVRACTLHEAGFGDGEFDAVTLWDCLEHTLDPIEVLAEVRRVLRPGGCCYLTVPDAGTGIARILGRRWFGYRKAGEHTFFFTRGAMRAALARVGLRPLHVGRGAWPCDLLFLAEKFAQYSPALSRIGVRLLQTTGWGAHIVRFPFIDMQVVAMRPGE